MKKFLNLTIIDIPQKRFSLPQKILFCQKSQLEKKILKKEYFSNRNKDFVSFYSQTIELLNKKSSLLCTISGGQDSILTFFILLHTKKKDDLQVLYCHHLWQIKNFFSAKAIFQISYLVKVPYTLVLPQNCDRNENQSRAWRKKNFFRFSQMEHILTTITGHTKTDTVEKNLNNILRGTSPAGLSHFRFLNYKNRSGLFFCSRNLNSCLFFKLEKRKTISQKFFYQTVNKLYKNKKTLFVDIKQSFCERNKFRYSKKINIFSQLEFFFKKEFYRQKNLLIDSQQIPKISKNKKSLLTTTKLFRFFYCTNFVLKNKKNRISKDPKSGSFCVSSELYPRAISLKKPFEKINRFSISKIIKLYKLPLLTDVTNFSFSFSRNKIRHQLIPFLRCLVNSNSESLLINFFTILEEETQEKENEIQEFFFLFKFFNFKEKRSPLEPGETFFTLVETLFLTKMFSKKTLIQNVSENKAKFLTQKLFFEYRNLNLNYLQITKLQNFY